VGGYLSEPRISIGNTKEDRHMNVTESIPIDMVAVTGDLVGYEITL
jgi:hypothetical protein